MNLRFPGSGRCSCHWVIPFALLSVACWPALLAAAPFGNPPVTSFYPELDVYPQNFDVTVGAFGDIIVANDDGLLVFDGERWRLVPMPNKDLVRTLSAPVATPAGTRIYVGGYNLFGYVEPAPTGEYHFVDLSAEFSKWIPENGFADIWDILVARQGVLFRGVKDAFLYDPVDPRRRLAWHRDERFGTAFEAAGQIHMPFRGDSDDAGLHVLEDDEWRPVAGGESLSDLIYAWLPLGGGRWLPLQADGDWQVYSAGKVMTMEMPDGFPPSSIFSDGLSLDEDSVVLTSDEGRLFFLDLGSRTFRQQQVGNRFLSGIHRTDDSLLVVDDAAVHHVAWPTRWTLLDKTQGIAGSLHKIVQWNSRWFLLGSSGVKGITDSNGDIRFRDLPWTDHEAWDLLVLDESRSLLAESYELRLLTDAGGSYRVIPLTGKTSYPRVLSRSRFDPEIVFAGTELGLLVLRIPPGDNTGESVSIRLKLEELGAPRVNSIVEMQRGEIWFGTDRGGVFRLLLNDTLDKVESMRQLQGEAGIAYGNLPSAEVILLDETLHATTERGMFTWNGQGFEPGDLGIADLTRNPGERLSLRKSPDGELWAFNYRQIFRQDGNGLWQEENPDTDLRGAIMDIVFAGKTNKPMVVAGDSVLQFQSAGARAAIAPPEVRLTAIRRLHDNRKQQALPLSPDTPLEFRESAPTLQFAFAVPAFHTHEDTAYRARLVPLEKEFSDWASISSFTYYRLAPGQYRFEVEARDSSGNISAAPPYRFYVKPRWYNSIEARVLWALLVLAFIAVASRHLVLRRLRKLHEDKQRLEKMVAVRTRELESANRQLQAMAHLDGLTEIANRRRLDEYLAEVWQQCQEHDRPLSLLVIDVDHFKRFNDRFGHVAGDGLLQKLARMLSRSLRRSEDLVARYGGEEFLVVLPGARLEAARELAEAMREHIEASSLGATISVGVATGMHAVTGNVTALVDAADKALYAAKAAGRNCVRVAED